MTKSGVLAPLPGWFRELFEFFIYLLLKRRVAEFLEVNVSPHVPLKLTIAVSGTADCWKVLSEGVRLRKG